jgi:hypothetical protein
MITVIETMEFVVVVVMIYNITEWNIMFSLFRVEPVADETAMCGY